MNILKNTNPMQTCLGLNPELRLATNRLNQGTATYKEVLKERFSSLRRCWWILSLLWCYGACRTVNSYRSFTVKL